MKRLRTAQAISITVPMVATKPHDPFGMPRSPKRVGALFALATAPTRSDDEVAEAAEMIAILADALEHIAATTSDPRSRDAAEYAMMAFRGG